MKIRYPFIFLLALLFLFAIDVKAFTQGVLERKVTVQTKDADIRKVLSLIEEQAQVKFAYSAENFKAGKLSLQYQDEALSTVLNQIFESQNIAYNVQGNLIVLYKQASKAVVVRGKVTDATGNPLNGVSVSVKGNTGGTSTNAEGNFTLSVADEEATLVFSYVGFTAQEVPLNGRTVVNVTLVSSTASVGEVVVVGYGTQKRENVIGSIATLQGDKLANRPVTQLQNALTGQLPGVTVTQRNGRPGSASGAISIRGVGSFGADPAALILVDGIPVGGFNDIDPNDVENISVLKDASSAAIYGARAANGVILVTTKSGAKGKTKITYNGYAGYQKPTALPEVLPSWEYAMAFNEGSPQPVYTDAEIQKFKDGSDPDHYPDIDFLRAILSKNGAQTGHNINVSGGNEGNQYNLSVGYLFQDGIVIKNNYSRYNVRLNMTTALSRKLSLTTRLAAISSNVNEPGTGVLGIIADAQKYPNIWPAIYSNGDYGDGIGLGGTPIAKINSKSYLKSNDLNMNGTFRLDYKITKGLKLSAITSYVRTDGNGKTFFATQKLRSITTGPNNLTETRTSSRYYTVQGLADYTKQFGKHQVNLLGGYSFESTSGENISAYRSNFPGNDLTVLGVGSPATQQSDGSAYEWAIESEFARANYSYSSRYLLEGVIRRDGSSRFPSTNKYAYFPSLAIGWRLGQERFIRENFSWISELKLKASRGVLGNQNIPNYPYQNTLQIINGTTGTVYSLGGTVVPGVARTQIVDTTLHWESTRTTDVGMEFGLFKNAITGSATWFNRYSYDILYSPSASVSNVLGFALSRQNTGSLENKGWEFTLNYHNTAGKVGFNINTNFSIINNKALDLGVGNIKQPNGLIGNGSTLFLGYPIQLYYGYVSDGLFVDTTDVKGWPSMTAVNPAPKPGDIRYKDISGPNGVPDGKVDPTYDRTYLGSQIPKYTYGINIGLNFKGFDVSTLLQGITGVQGNLAGNFGIAFNNGANIQRWQYDERWTPANPNRYATYPRLEVLSNAGSPNTLQSSFWILDGSYLRIKNAQIGYTVPKQLLQKAGIGNARFYLSGENLHTFDNYRQGWDPEINTGTNFYPILANYTFGVNVTF
jgi:TonB-linked SusC/RagA family outer membrane protein